MLIKEKSSEGFSIQRSFYSKIPCPDQEVPQTQVVDSQENIQQVCPFHEVFPHHLLLATVGNKILS